jgi:hypothetical protein
VSEVVQKVKKVLDYRTGHVKKESGSAFEAAEVYVP